MGYKFCFVFAIVVQCVTCRKDVSRVSVRDDIQGFSSCKSQLGQAKNSAQNLKQFCKQAKEVCPEDEDISKDENAKLKAEMAILLAFKTKTERFMNDLLKQNGGPTYVRWGRTTCGGRNTAIVYKGQAGGGYYTHKGSSVNYICLPDSPDIGHYLSHGHVDYLYGAEYEIFNYNKPYGMTSGLAEHDVPCVVCQAIKKVSSIMIAGRRNCYNGWTKEYEGYLMAGYYNHDKASEYACMDKYPETRPAGSANKEGALFYPVKTACGSLSCPKYAESRDVPCVVCSK